MSEAVDRGGGGVDVAGQRYLDADRQAFVLGKRNRGGVLPGYPLNPLSGFRGGGGGGGASSGGGDASDILDDVRRLSRVKRLRGALTHYEHHPFVETDKNQVVRDLMVNTLGPFGVGFAVKQHEVMFEYRGVEVLRRRNEVNDTAAFAAAAAANDDHDHDDDAFSSSSFFRHRRSSRPFLEGRFWDKKTFEERDRIWQKLRFDYGVPARESSPHRALVTCIPLSKLKSCIRRYAEAALRLRESNPATDDPTRATSWRFHKELVDRSARVASDGNAYDAHAVEALFALVESPTDLYDLVRPMDTCHEGEPETRARKDGGGVDLLQVLIGGEGRLRLPDDYERDDDNGGSRRICERGVGEMPLHSMCADAWLVYRQKTIRHPLDGGRRRLPASGDGSLDAYPDVDLFVTEKPREKFVQDFLGREKYASYPIRGRPREPAPIVFCFLGTLVENTHGPMGRGRVVQYHAGLALHQCRPVVAYPSIVKSP